jgi:hypothetical protein
MEIQTSWSCKTQDQKWLIKIQQATDLMSKFLNRDDNDNEDDTILIGKNKLEIRRLFAEMENTARKLRLEVN